MARPVIFVHGMFMTPLCWEGWLERYAAKGYDCRAPAWPGRDRPIEELRSAHPDPALGRLTLTDVVGHFETIIRGMDQKPVAIGHSMGGLVTQILLHRGLLAAGVVIDTAPPVGVFTTKWSFLRANWPMISPFTSKFAPRAMPFEDFQYAFVNTLPLDQQRAAFERYVVPESRMVPRDGLGAIGKIDFARPHAPLLFTAGADDHIIPASLNRSNHQKYTDPASICDFREFPGRDHFVIGEPGWEEVADFVDSWIVKAVARAG